MAEYEGRRVMRVMRAGESVIFYPVVLLGTLGFGFVAYSYTCTYTARET